MKALKFLRCWQKRDNLMKIVMEAPSITRFLTGNLYSMFLYSFITSATVRINIDLRPIKEIGREQVSKTLFVV